MQVESITIEISNTDNPTTEYIESELQKRNINPLRWAIVDVAGNELTISVSGRKLC